REARRRLEIEKPRRRPDVIAESCKLAHAEKGDFDAEARQHVACEDERRTVRARLKDPVISAREVRKKRRRDRAHSRCERKRVLAPFEPRDLLLENARRRVRFARVEETATLAAKPLLDRPRALES